jgi:hypothetical protein
MMAMLAKICKGITTKKMFLSFSPRKGLMNAHPVPIRAITTNIMVPFRLHEEGGEKE